MGATFSRLKTWVAETLTASDVNAEFDNVLDNLTPAGMDDYSANVTEMQTQTDPGEVGTESLATSTAEELERMRYQIAQLQGTTYWYTNPVTTLASLNTAFGNSLPASRLVSGEVRTASSQSYLLTPEGSAGDNVVINGATTDLVYNVDSTEYTLSSDVTITATSAPPLTNNTATVNDASLADQAWTKWTGMHGGGIPIDAIGSEITSRNGVLTAFKLATAAGNEYILGVPDTTNNQIKDIKRGYYFDETGAPIPSIVFADDDILTLMRITYVFLVNDSTASVTTNEPVISATEPTSPNTGDYWFDMVNDTWKVFGGVSFAASNAVYIGTCITDENDDCVGARSEDFVKTYVPGNTAELEYVSATKVQTSRGARIGVYGDTIDMRIDNLLWDMTADLDTGITEAASTMYFFYVTETGLQVISDIAPDDFVATRGGLYHPHQTWRCVGQAWNDASQDLGKVISYHTDDAGVAMASSSVAANALTLEYWSSPLVKYKLYDQDDINNAKPKESQFPFYQSITVPSGATLGHTSSAGAAATTMDDNVVLHILTIGNYVTLGVSSHQYGQGRLPASTALDATSDLGLLYSATAYSSMNARAVAHGLSEQTTAGTWASNLDYFQAGAKINICRTFKSATSGNFATTLTTPQTVITTTFGVTGSRTFTIAVDASTASTSDASRLVSGNGSGNTTSSFLYFYYNSAIQRSYRMGCGITGATDVDMTVPASCLACTVTPAEITVGSQTIQLQAESVPGTTSTVIEDVRLVITELPYAGDL